MSLRIKELDEIVENLFSYHNNGQLYAQLTQASCWIANVTLHAEKFGFSCYSIPGIIKKSSLWDTFN